MTPLGKFQLETVSGGRFHIDGGTMFGVVPKPLWNRRIPADDYNRIVQDTKCVLVTTDEHRVLIDTGFGPKLNSKQCQIMSIADGEPLVESLQQVGCSVDEIDIVILTHLHFDHAGGATRNCDDGSLEVTFPNARYIAQQGEWEAATSGVPELRGAYPLENLLPLQESGQLEFIEGDREIVPGFRSLVTGGHTHHHQAIVIESDGDTAVYLADLCPTSHHLPSLWGMAYDVDMLQTRRKKAEVLKQITDNNWLALFDHDPDVAAARLKKDDRRDFAVVESMDAL